MKKDLIIKLIAVHKEHVKLQMIFAEEKEEYSLADALSKAHRALSTLYRLLTFIPDDDLEAVISDLQNKNEALKEIRKITLEEKLNIKKRK